MENYETQMSINGTEPSTRTRAGMDREILTIQRCIRVLDELPEEVPRQRVVSYLCDRYLGTDDGETDEQAQ